MAPKSIAAVLAAVAAPLIAAGCGGSALQKYQKELMASRTGRGYSEYRSGLALSIRARKDVFTMQEPIMIDYQITNITNMSKVLADINVYAEMQLEGILLRYEIYKLTGKGREQVYVSKRLDVRPDQENPADYSHYVRLMPGYFFGRPIQINPMNLKGSGIYEMTAYYDNSQETCVISPRLTRDQISLLETDKGNCAFVQLWTGSLKSNTIVFELKRK